MLFNEQILSYRKILGANVWIVVSRKGMSEECINNKLVNSLTYSLFNMLFLYYFMNVFVYVRGDYPVDKQKLNSLFHTHNYICDFYVLQ